MAFNKQGSTQQKSYPKQAQQSSAAGQEKRSYDDIVAEVTHMKKADGKETLYVKFSRDVVNNDSGLFIPKGTILDFDTYEAMQARQENPSPKFASWLEKQTTPFTTATGAVLTGIGQLKTPFKKNS